jgi:serine/threonine-protein kinase
MTTPLPPDDAETRVVPPGSAPPAHDPEPSPSRGLGWGMLLAILVLIAVAAAAAAVYFATRDDGASNATETTTSTPAPTTTRSVSVLAAGKVFVPDVTGLNKDDAVARLGSAHLVPVLEYKPTKKPTGKVVAQAPKAATKAKRNSTVTLTVDKGAPSIAVPDLAGLKVADATAKLKAAGLKAQTTQVTAAGKPAGTVVSQAPEPGEKAPGGSAVTLSVAKGGGAGTTTAQETTTAPAATTTTAPPTTATVPDLGGMDVQAASQALSQANLKATLAYVPGEDPLGTVQAQKPASGESAPVRSHVTVNASSGPNAEEQATVPDTAGQTLQQAVSTLNGAGLRLIFVKVPVTTQASIGKVVEQTPAAGKQAPKNAQVLVYLGVKG